VDGITRTTAKRDRTNWHNACPITYFLRIGNKDFVGDFVQLKSSFIHKTVASILILLSFRSNSFHVLTKFIPTYAYDQSKDLNRIDTNNEQPRSHFIAYLILLRQNYFITSGGHSETVLYATMHTSVGLCYRRM